MNVSKLLKIYIKNNPKSGMPKYEKVIRRLMGHYIVSRVDEKTMNRLLINLDFLTYEAGNTIAKEKLLLQIDALKRKKVNMRQHFHFTSSTLFNVLEGRKVSIEFALEFCRLNNLSFKDNFTVYSIKKSYSIEYKECAKGYIKRLFEYAVKLKILKTNPVPYKYRFKIDSRRMSLYLPKNHIKEYVEAMFNYKNMNGRIMVIIYILVGLNLKIMYNLKIKNINYKKNLINYAGHNYPMSDYISKILSNYFANEDPNNSVISSKHHSYLRCVLYRIREDCKKSMITIETLKANYKTLIEELNEYQNDDEITLSNFKENGLDSKMQYNDFYEFLRLKRLYEVE